jgi:protein-disulfide isomerase
LGPTDAPVTIVYYGDYECPSCANHSSALAEAITKFSGQVRLIWKDLPNPRLHPEARNAALAARCAGEQGYFWEYHDRLYEDQNALTATNYVIFARQLGLDQESFETCLAEERPKALIDRDIEEAIELGVNATPYTFIGDRRMSGALSAAELELLIEQALNAPAQ